MPFDGTYSKFDVLLTGLPGMAQIAEGLRGDFSSLLAWNFNAPLCAGSEYAHITECGYLGCGVGYAHRRWPHQVKRPNLDTLARVLQLPQEEIGAVFGYIGMPKYYPGKVHDDVTPLMVADAIDTFIDSKGGILGT